MNPSLVALLPKLKRRADLAKHFFAVRFRDPEQGGYVHDTATSYLVPVQSGIMTVGAWTDVAGAVAGSYAKRVTAAANSPVFAIPLNPPQNSVALKGSYLKSIDIVYIIGTAAETTVTMAINQETLPANAAAYPAKVNPAFTYDANHLTNANRITQAQHTLTMTVTAPYWLANTEQDFLEVTLANPGTAVFDLYAVRINTTLRM